MKRLLLLLLLIVTAAPASAQYSSTGVELVDEPDMKACFQYVARSATAEYADDLMVGLAVDEGTFYTINFVREDLEPDELVFSLYGHLPGDEVILTFRETGEVVPLDVQYGSSEEIPETLLFRESALVETTAAFLRDLVDYGGDLGVRFANRTGEYEFTLEQAFLKQFEPFVEVCL